LDQLTKSLHWERSVATIADVARKEGVSASTAWHVLNGTPRVVAPAPAHPLAAIEAFGDLLDIVARGQHGLRVPKDLPVIDFNDTEWTKCFEPRLTLVAQPSPPIDRGAALPLRERIAVPSSSRRATSLEAAIVEGKSCCRPK
jgi:DNA-binding LacI/PurR family transcriptional regulator